MNALDIIEACQQRQVTLTVEDGRLVAHGSGAPLPDALRRAIVQHRPELMVALGVPTDIFVADVLAEVRQHLTPTLRQLSDGQLLALINWHIMHAWNAALRKLAESDQRFTA